MGWKTRHVFLLYDCFLALVLCLLVSGCWVYHIYMGVFLKPRFKDQPLMVKVHGDRNRVASFSGGHLDVPGIMGYIGVT